MTRATCHCGAVELKGRLPDGLATARRCNSSFCRRRSAAAVTAPLDGVRVVRGADKLTLYRWNTLTAEHWFCSICGIYTHHRRRPNPNEYGVDMAALDGVDPSEHEPIPWADRVNHPSDRKGQGPTLP